MAEIADSDSPDPLSSTPLRFAPSTPISSLPSTISDLDSLLSESQSSGSTQPQSRLHQTPRYSSSPPTVTPSSMSSGNESDILDFLDRFIPNRSPQPSEDHYFDDWDDAEVDLDDPPYSDDESLFVNDRNDNDGDLNLLAPRAVNLDFDEDYFEENQLFGNLPIDIMDRAGDIEDELVEMEFQEINVDRPRSPLDRQRPHRRPEPRVQPEVIDLTGDNDSPPHTAYPRRSQNVRRQRSQQRNTPPRLARSDASYMGSHTVINLISDSDEDPAELPRPRGRSRISVDRDLLRDRDRHRPHHQHRPRMPPPDEHFGMAGNAFHRFQALIHNMPIFRLVNNPQALGDNREEDDIVLLGQRNLMPDPLPAPNLPPIEFNYNAHPFANIPAAAGGPAAKPAHEPPKETREGFTRNTGEDVVAICPSCEEELAYDPDGDEANSGPPPTKKARTKKDKAEHHFWAVKACGHVYCRKCYENRKPVGKNPIPVGFRPDSNGTKNKMLCAVEDCDSDVSAKSAWVGIFM
ncbi:hypothetical protein M434DRAFT_28571 [Hypoxylon sp. CO27-5]|nr:hypothetical protein M434DRAFT_28571 [Hypoxylon sp. CO27-5]